VYVHLTGGTRSPGEGEVVT